MGKNKLAAKIDVGRKKYPVLRAGIPNGHEVIDDNVTGSTVRIIKQCLMLILLTSEQQFIATDSQLRVENRLARNQYVIGPAHALFQLP
ncbi:hypothetical protein [Pokkaliibacter plantistimulans]|uniref:hypothetical protein n=1 Tax=Pokkaliibacter plantistimulans TaxID=1635171 RepID=UPI002D797F87|nr:hypothetical protein [Pokkaliibacter plantistimulans]